MSRFDRALPLLVAFVAVLVQLPIYDRWYTLFDEGLEMVLARDIVAGHVLYRDVYVDAPFPGAFYLLAAVFAVCGQSIWISRVVMVAVFALFAGLVTRLAQEVLPRLGVLAVAVLVLCYRIWAFPHWQMYNYSPLAATALAAAVVLVAHALRTGSPGTLVAAGVAAGTGILCKQDYGVAVSGMLGILMLVLPWLRPATPDETALHRALFRAVALAAGALLVLVPVFAAIAAAGALPAMIEQTFLVPMRGAAGAMYTRLPPLLPLLGQSFELRNDPGAYLPSVLLSLRWRDIATSWSYMETSLWDVGVRLVYYAPFVVTPLATLCWVPAAIRRPGGATPRDVARLVVLAWAIAFLLAFNRPHDWIHLMMILPPTLVVGAVLCADAGALLPRPLARALAGGVFLGLATLVVASLDVGAQLHRDADMPLPSARAGVRALPEHVGIVDDTLRWIASHAPPGEPVPVWPMQPMLGFLADRDTAGGYHVIWPFQAADRDARIVADLERRRPHAIVYSVSQYRHLGTFADNAPALFDYLVRHYRLTATFGRDPAGLLFTGLERRPDDVPPPAVDLLATPTDDAGAARVQWPFAEVLAVPSRPPAAARPARLPVHVPEGRPHLRYAVGVDPQRWNWPGRGPFTFTTTVGDTMVSQQVLDPDLRIADRRWVDVDVDLTPWAGRDVVVGFAVTSPAGDGGEAPWTGWAEPRVELAAPAGS